MWFIGVVFCIVLFCVWFEETKKANSRTVAKYLEQAIEADKVKGTKVEGFCDLNEVVRVMAEDGYNFFKFYKIEGELESEL